MSSLVTVDSEAVKPAIRRDRVAKLASDPGFQWFEAKLKKLEQEAHDLALSKSATPVVRAEALTRYWLLHDEIARIVPNELKLAEQALAKVQQPPQTPT